LKEKNSDEYQRVFHKSKTMLALINDHEFSKVTHDVKEKLNQQKEISKIDLLDFNRMADELIRGFEEKQQIVH